MFNYLLLLPNCACVQMTELFIVHLAKQSYAHTLKGKRKTIQKRDLDAAVPLEGALAFLEGTID